MKKLIFPLLLAGCASSSSSEPSTVADTGTRDALTEDVAVGSDGGADGGLEGGTDGATFRCTEHTSAACMPKTLEPYGGGHSLAILDGEVYWFRKTALSYELVRTSLATDVSRAIPQPTEAKAEAVMASQGDLLAADGRVFSISAYCCGAIENAIVALDPTTDAWQFTNVGVPQSPSLHAIGGGQIYVGLGAYILDSWSTATLTKTADFRPKGDMRMLGSDGTTLFGVVTTGSGPITYGVIAFDGTPSGKLLAAIPSEPGYKESELAFDATSIYYSYDTVVARVAKVGGEPKTVVDLAPSHTLQLVVDDDDMYVADESHVYAVSRTDSTKTKLADVTGTVAMVQDRDWLVWLSKEGLTKVHR